MMFLEASNIAPMKPSRKRNIPALSRSETSTINSENISHLESVMHKILIRIELASSGAGLELFMLHSTDCKMLMN